MRRPRLGSSRLRLSVVTLALSFSVTVGCARNGPDAVSGPTEGGDVSIENKKTDSDGMITAAVERKFAAEGRIDDATVETTAANGVVTLTGRVPEEHQKERLGAIAAEVAGVKGVDNRLMVARGAALP